ncbi:MAG: OadG family protein [Oscillospiraceae bacterium]|nr:OadG family protein [Oscillospiraceae bacterium]
MDWNMALSTVATGIAVVFIILILLIGMLFLMSKLATIGYKPTIMPVNKSFTLQKPVYTKPAVKPEPVPENIDVPEPDDLEIIAVITAAVSAFSAANGKQARIVGIKKRDKQTRRSAWGGAGVSESMSGMKGRVW